MEINGCHSWEHLPSEALEFNSLSNLKKNNFLLITEAIYVCCSNMRAYKQTREKRLPITSFRDAARNPGGNFSDVFIQLTWPSVFVFSWNQSYCLYYFAACSLKVEHSRGFSCPSMLTVMKSPLPTPVHGGIPRSIYHGHCAPHDCQPLGVAFHSPHGISGIWCRDAS